MVGKFAKSKAGHDKNQIYVILKEDENVSRKINENEMLTNEEIKVAIKRAFDGK